MISSALSTTCTSLFLRMNELITKTKTPAKKCETDHKSASSSNHRDVSDDMRKWKPCDCMRFLPGQWKKPQVIQCKANISKLAVHVFLQVQLLLFKSCNRGDQSQLCLGVRHSERWWISASACLTLLVCIFPVLLATAVRGFVIST